MNRCLLLLLSLLLAACASESSEPADIAASETESHEPADIAPPEADAPEPPTPFVFEGETKPMYGILRSLQAGDIACYADFQDESGDGFYEMADFEICDLTDLIDTRVQLTYDTASVLAADCEGDMDCGRSDTVALIVEMHPAGGSAPMGAGQGDHEIPEHGYDEAIANGIDPMTGLPLELVEAVEEALPGFRVADESEWLAPEYLTAYNEAVAGDWQASYEDDIFLKADFNGDGRDDFAAFVVSPEGEASAVALHATDSGYEGIPLESLGPLDGCCLGMGLRLAPAGASYAVLSEEGTELNWELTGPGIEVSIYEKGSDLYAWVEGEYRWASYRD